MKKSILSMMFATIAGCALAVSTDAGWRWSTDGGNTWTTVDSTVVSGGPFANTLTTGALGDNIVELLSDCTFAADLNVYANLIVRSAPWNDFTLKRAANDKMFVMKAAKTLKLEGFTLDGGAVWDSDDITDSTLAEGFSGTIGKTDASGSTIVLGKNLIVQNVKMTATAFVSGANTTNEVAGAKIVNCRGTFELFRSDAVTKVIKMSAGEITGCANMSSNGQGTGQRWGMISLYGRGVFVMTGGSIHDIKGSGCVISIRGTTSTDSSTVAYLYGGEIINNRMTWEAGTIGQSASSGGVYVNGDWGSGDIKGSHVYVGGDFVCTNNYSASGVLRNIYLVNNGRLYMSKPLLKHASIGVTIYSGAMVAKDEGETDYASAANLINDSNAAQVAVRSGETTTLVWANGTDPEPYDISSAVVTLANESFSFNTRPKECAVTSVVLSGVPLTEGVDYRVEYANNVNAGNAAEAQIVGIGDYAGVAVANFTISGIGYDDITLQPIAGQDYTGSAVEPDPELLISVGEGVVRLRQGRDYSLLYTNNVAAGTATVTITGLGNVVGSTSRQFVIVPSNLAKAEVDITPAIIGETGSAIVPEIVVKFAGVPLVEGTDYTLDILDNVNPGLATITITGKNNRTGTKVVHFEITPRPFVSAANVTGVGKSVFTRDTLPEPVISANGRVLVEGIDYKISYRRHAGRIEVTVDALPDSFWLRGSYTASLPVESQPTDGVYARYTKDGANWTNVTSEVFMDGVTLDAPMEYELLRDQKLTANLNIGTDFLVHSAAGLRCTLQRTASDKTMIANADDISIKFKNIILDGGDSDNAVVQGRFIQCAKTGVNILLGKDVTIQHMRPKNVNNAYNSINVEGTQNTLTIDGAEIIDCVGPGSVVYAGGTSNVLDIVKATVTRCTNTYSWAANNSGVSGNYGLFTLRGSGFGKMYIRGGDFYDNETPGGVFYARGVAGGKITETHLMGGFITNNVATQQGGGVYVEGDSAGAKLFLSGDPVVWDNTLNGITNRNVQFAQGNTSTYLTSRLGRGAKLGFWYCVGYMSWGAISNYMVSGKRFGSVAEDYDAELRVSDAANIINDNDGSLVGKGQADGQLVWTAGTDPEPFDISAAEISGVERRYRRDGTRIRPKPVLTFNEVALVEEVDYELEYGENLESGTGTILVRGRGDYVGQITIEFEVYGKPHMVVIFR